MSEFLQSRAKPCAAGTYYIYILASGRHGTLYIGVTNDLRTRLEQHRSGRGSEFVKKYGVHRLVHVEAFASPQEAIAREKQTQLTSPTRACRRNNWRKIFRRIGGGWPRSARRARHLPGR
jgi:putative endonuclease